MSDAIKNIIVDFEADLLASIRAGAREDKLESIFEGAVYRLRPLKDGAANDFLEAIFTAFFEMEAKLKMTMETIKS